MAIVRSRSSHRSSQGLRSAGRSRSRRRPGAAASQPPLTPPPAGRSLANGESPKRYLLLLDDEEETVSATAAYFRSLGFSVDVAREPEEAGALVQERRYDVAILDLRVTPLGGIEGLEVLHEIRWRHCKTVVILLSASVSSDVEAAARALGSDAVLRKPHPLPDLATLAFVLLGAKDE